MFITSMVYNTQREYRYISNICKRPERRRRSLAFSLLNINVYALCTITLYNNTPPNFRVYARQKKSSTTVQIFRTWLWQNLKCFDGAFHWALTPEIGRNEKALRFLFVVKILLTTHLFWQCIWQHQRQIVYLVIETKFRAKFAIGIEIHSLRDYTNINNECL